MNKKHPWFKNRGYVQFDTPINLKTAEKRVMAVNSHAFLPLIQYQIETRKIKKSPSGKAMLCPIKIRPISFASHVDSQIYSYYSSKLQVMYEEKLRALELCESVIVFRSLKKSNIHFADTAFEKIKSTGNCTVFATDIEKFFDKIDHDHLKKAWAYIINEDRLPKDHYSVFKSLTKYSYVLRSDILSAIGIPTHRPPTRSESYCTPLEFRTKIRGAGLIKTNTEKFGIPQGSPTSALLSNIYLLEFESEIYSKVK